MGCGASTTDDTITSDKPNASDGENNNHSSPKAKQNGHVGSAKNRNRVTPEKLESQEDKENQRNFSSHNKGEGEKDVLKPASKGVAFDIVLDNSNKIDSIISKHPPKRLKRLDPLENAPKLTASMLEEKLQQAEEKRQRELETIRQKSRRSSKLRSNIQQAREYEKTAQLQELEGKQKTAEQLREKKLRDMEERKKLREERARRARERARRLKAEGNEDLEFEVEKDEAFNKDDDADSWLERGDTNMSGAGDPAYSDMGDRIYSGRESPSKAFKPKRNSAEIRARMSASTTDSFDNAFQRKPASGISRRLNDFEDEQSKDDFFDS